MLHQVSAWAAALDDSLKKGSPSKKGGRVKKDKPEVRWCM